MNAESARLRHAVGLFKQMSDVGKITDKALQFDVLAVLRTCAEPEVAGLCLADRTEGIPLDVTHALWPLYQQLLLNLADTFEQHFERINDFRDAHGLRN